MNQDPLARGGVWDVRPPEHGLGRRRSPKRRQAAPAAPSRARAPSPLLPRIASRGDAGAGHARGNSVVNEMEARLAMLEERVSNVDRENGFLRHQLDTLGTSLQARLRQDNEVRRARCRCCKALSRATSTQGPLPLHGVPCCARFVAVLTSHALMLTAAVHGRHAAAVQDARADGRAGPVHGRGHGTGAEACGTPRRPSAARCRRAAAGAGAAAGQPGPGASPRRGSWRQRWRVGSGCRGSCGVSGTVCACACPRPRPVTTTHM